MKQESEFLTKQRKFLSSFRSSASLATVRERAFLGEYSFIHIIYWQFLTTYTSYENQSFTFLIKTVHYYNIIPSRFTLRLFRAILNFTMFHSYRPDSLPFWHISHNIEVRTIHSLITLTAQESLDFSVSWQGEEMPIRLLGSGWIYILVSIFFSERIYLFSYSTLKSVLGDFFFLSLSSFKIKFVCSAKFWY
jgi:hypothetical protein